jgi:hypothetical protein
MELRKKVEVKKADKGDRSTAFSQVGEYVCKVKEFRRQPESEQYAEMYFIDLEVVSGPADVGALKFYVMSFNPNKYITTKNEKGQAFTGKQKRTRDEENLQINFAACLGYAADSAGEIAELYESMEAAFEDQSRIGGLVDVVVTSTVAKKGPHAGKTFFNPSLAPHKGTVAPALPTAPAAVKLPEGWTQHPGDARYAFNGGDVKLISELVG